MLDREEVLRIVDVAGDQGALLDLVVSTPSLLKGNPEILRVRLQKSWRGLKAGRWMKPADIDTKLRAALDGADAEGCSD